MSDLLAATALHVELVVSKVACIVLVFLIFVLFLVLGEFAAAGFFLRLAAAPPHLTAEFALVSAAAPVVVLFLEEILTTLLADFGPFFELSATAFKLFNSIHHFISFGNQLLLLLVHFFQRRTCEFKLLLEVLRILLHLSDALFECIHRDNFFLLHAIFDLD